MQNLCNVEITVFFKGRFCSNFIATFILALLVLFCRVTSNPLDINCDWKRDCIVFFFAEMMAFCNWMKKLLNAAAATTI